MRYNQIRETDIANGEGVGVALFVQGCPFHCYNCFNPETWDFNGGKEWTEEIENRFIELANRPYIKRISILGGEPLADENLSEVLNLINKIRLSLPQKTIWLYTGYTCEDVWCSEAALREEYSLDYCKKVSDDHKKRQQIIKLCDVLIDGKYIDSAKDITLKWCGSSNQRVINIQETLNNGKIVLWTN